MCGVPDSVGPADPSVGVRGDHVNIARGPRQPWGRSFSGEVASMSASLQALSRSLADCPGAAAREGPDLGTGIWRSFYKQMGEKKQGASPHPHPFHGQDLACPRRLAHSSPWAGDKANARSYIPFRQEVETLWPERHGPRALAGRPFMMRTIPSHSVSFLPPIPRSQPLPQASC